MHAQRQPSVSTHRDAAEPTHLISDPMTRWELQRFERATRPSTFRREVAGNVIRYLPLPQPPVVPCPGEDGERQAMSEAVFWVCFGLLAIGALGIGLLQKAGLQ